MAEETKQDTPVEDQTPETVPADGDVADTPEGDDTLPPVTVGDNAENVADVVNGLSRNEKIEQLLSVLTETTKTILKTEEERRKERESIFDQQLDIVLATVTTMTTIVQDQLNTMLEAVGYLRKEYAKLEEEKPYSRDIKA